MALARVNALFVDRIERLGLVRVSRTPSSDGDAAASPSPSGSRRSDAPCASNDESGADDGDYLEINFAPTPPWTLWNLAQTTWGFLLAHYIFYGFVASALACAFIELTAVKAALAVGLVLYQKSFWDGSELRSGRPWHAFRAHPVWNLTQSYFPARLIRTRALDASEKYVFGWHPHGILILSRIMIYGGVWELLFPGVPFRVLAASPMFKVPGCREICLWMGAVDAGRTTASRVLDDDCSVAVYPGGSREIFSTDPNSSETKVYLSKRRGFVKLAIAHGAALVPVFVFGEKRCYRRLNVPAPLRDWLLRTWKIPLIVFWGRWFTWYPYAARQTVVFGAPIDTKKHKPPAGEDPSEARVDEVHAEYVEAVRALFQAHKRDAGYGEEETLTVI